MATPAATLAVLRASRPRCRHASDVLAFAVHAATCSAGFRLVAAGPGANDPSAASAPADPSADPLDGWDAWEDTHAFRYVPETTGSVGARLVRDETASSSNVRATDEENEIRSVTVTSMTVGDACVVSVAVVRGSGKKNETASLQVPLAQHVDASLASTDPAGALRDVDALVSLANERLFSRVGARKNAADDDDDEKNGRASNATSDGTAVRETGENARRAPPPEHGRVPLEGPRPPPGARFDPYGPPDIPEFAPGRFGFDPDPTRGFPENPDAAFGGVPDGFHPSWPGGPGFPPGGGRGFPPPGWPPARGRGRGPPDLGPPPRGGGGFF